MRGKIHGQCFSTSFGVCIGVCTLSGCRVFPIVHDLSHSRSNTSGDTGVTVLVGGAKKIVRFVLMPGIVCKRLYFLFRTAGTKYGARCIYLRKLLCFCIFTEIHLPNVRFGSLNPSVKRCGADSSIERLGCIAIAHDGWKEGRG